MAKRSDDGILYWMSYRECVAEATNHADISSQVLLQPTWLLAHCPGVRLRSPLCARLQASLSHQNVTSKLLGSRTKLYSIVLPRTEDGCSLYQPSRSGPTRGRNVSPPNLEIWAHIGILLDQLYCTFRCSISSCKFTARLLGTRLFAA